MRTAANPHNTKQHTYQVLKQEKRKAAMKQNIHPEYREVVFMDVQTGGKFIIGSTVNTRETIDLDGKTYPLFKCDVSSQSHPFYTGAQTRIVETGRVEKFRARFARTAGTAKSAS
jgi:large subunit ribosomal protein L31